MMTMTIDHDNHEYDEHDDHLRMAMVGTKKEKVPPWMIGNRTPRLL